MIYDDGSSLQQFDDGSSIVTDSTGVTVGLNSDGIPVNQVTPDGDYYRSPGYWNDAREQQKLDPYVARSGPDDQRPWWQRVAEYGMTRAIDNHYGPSDLNKSGAPGTFAGQNGRTYTRQPVTPGAPTMATMPGAWMLALAVGAFFLLKK